MSKLIAKNLIEKGCVRLSPQKPFTYASGLKGPIYCDNRLILSHVEFRELIIEEFLNVIKRNQLSFDFIGGIATAGIPHAAFIADRLKSPMVYVRPKPKEHGKKNQVEGDYLPNQSVLLVEDLVNQGASLSEAHAGLSSAQLITSACLCIVDYQMSESKKRLVEMSLNLYSLCDFETLVEVGRELNFIDSTEVQMLQNWHSDPKNWGKDF